MSEGTSATGQSVETPAVPVEPSAAQPSAGEATGPAQSELDLGVVPTGHHQVDAALEQLEFLPELPVTEHAPLYEDVHARLNGVLTQGPGPGDDPAAG